MSGMLYGLSLACMVLSFITLLAGVASAAEGKSARIQFCFGAAFVASCAMTGLLIDIAGKA